MDEIKSIHQRSRNLKTQQLKAVIIILLLTGISSLLQAQTTITVDWALDEEPNNNNHTCSYTQGGLFFPDTTGSGAGKCTLRRALREAGAIANDSFCNGCAPVTIVFSGLNGSDGNADDIQFSGGQWVIPVSGAASSSDFGLFPQTITDVSGPVSIVGFPVNVQGNNEMPQIMVQSTQTMEVELNQVLIQSIGFFGGMSIHAKEADFTFQYNTWGLTPDGLEVAFSNFADNTDYLAGNHGVLGLAKADRLLVQNNIITGASTYAVEVNSAAEEVEVLNNWIGTNINGTVPAVPTNLACRTFTNINPVNPPVDSAEWFGGAGINAAGTGLIIEGNYIAGLQNIRSTNDPPPQALTVFGALHSIENNVIGQGVNGDVIGVCGQGIKFSTQTDVLDPQNNGHLVINNIIDSARNGFENTKGAILWIDTSSPAFRDGGNTVRGNLVIDGPEKYFEIGPMIATAIKLFEPAEITNINGLVVTGGNNNNNIMGDPSPCPNCIIDFYLDDDDADEEGLDYLGFASANANGDFTFNLTQPLAEGFGIRTTSTSVANDVIPNTWAFTTTSMSNQVYGLANDDVIFENSFE